MSASALSRPHMHVSTLHEKRSFYLLDSAWYRFLVKWSFKENVGLYSRLVSFVSRSSAALLKNGTRSIEDRKLDNRITSPMRVPLERRLRRRRGICVAGLALCCNIKFDDARGKASKRSTYAMKESKIACFEFLEMGTQRKMSRSCTTQCPGI